MLPRHAGYTCLQCRTSVPSQSGLKVARPVRPDVCPARVRPRAVGADPRVIRPVWVGGTHFALAAAMTERAAIQSPLMTWAKSPRGVDLAHLDGVSPRSNRGVGTVEEIDHRAIDSFLPTPVLGLDGLLRGTVSCADDLRLPPVPAGNVSADGFRAVVRRVLELHARTERRLTLPSGASDEAASAQTSMMNLLAGLGELERGIRASINASRRIR